MNMNTNNQGEKKNKPKIDISKRRFGKVALLATPILATLPGKPAMALYEKNNCTVSGNISGNMSDNTGQTDPCDTFVGGKAPSFWVDNSVQWANCGLTGQYMPGPNTPTMFDEYFGGGRQAGFSLMQVMQGQGNLDVDQLDAHAAAALLNAECFGPNIYGYSPDEVMAIYNDFYLNNPVELRQAFQYLNDKG